MSTQRLAEQIETLPKERDRVIVTHNARAGRRSAEKEAAALCESLRALGLRPEIITDLDDVVGEAEHWLDNGELRAVVGMGGDGTQNLLLNRTPPGTPLIPYPSGTENLLAKYLGLPFDVEGFARVVAAGRAATLDAGQVGDRLFLLMLSAGFDAEVVRQLHEARQGRINHLSYLRPILQSLWEYSFPQIRMHNGAGEPHTVKWCFAFNLPCYARNLQFTPDASAVDGLLNVCTFEHGGWVRGAEALVRVVMGWHRSMPGCRLEQTAALRLESDRPIPYQVDGDPAGWLPAEIRIVPGRLTLLTAPPAAP